MMPREEHLSIRNPDARAAPETGDQIKSSPAAFGRTFRLGKDEGASGFAACFLPFVNVASFKILAKLQLHFGFECKK